MLTAAIRGAGQLFRQRRELSTFLDELVSIKAQASAPRRTHQSFPMQTPDIHEPMVTFNRLRYLTITTLPTREWEMAFRKRLAVGPFRPDQTNWSTIMCSVGRLGALRVNRGRNANVNPKHHVSVLPPDWYPLLLELASDCETTNKDSSIGTTAFLWVMRLCKVQFSGELQSKAVDLFERHCTSTDQFIEPLVAALNLGYPVSRRLWQRLADSDLERMLPRDDIHRLLDLAARYWALWLPGAPPAVVLHRLILTYPLHRSVTARWHLLYQLIGEEFMPQDMLRQIEAGVKANRQPNCCKHTPSNPELEQRLMCEHGAVKIERNVRLPKTAGIIVNYVLTKADGSQKALCDSHMIGKSSYYWLVPDDVEGGPTIPFRVNAYLIKRAGYDFGFFKKGDERMQH